MRWLARLRRLSQSITLRSFVLSLFLVLIVFGGLIGLIRIMDSQIPRSEYRSARTSSLDHSPQSDRSEPPRIQKLQTRVQSFTLQRSVSSAQQKTAQVSFLGAEAASKAAILSEVKIYELRYEVQQTGMDWIPQSARVYVPVSKDNKSPVYLFAAGTSGLADDCAPSREQVQRANIGNYENHMITQASQDYIAVLPDYEGFHDGEKFQPYFVADSEARSMLGALQALEQLEDEPSLRSMQKEQLFLTGYSQGGHAALAAANRWSMIDTAFTLQGVVGYGPAFDVFDIFRDIPQLAPYLVVAYAQEYPDQISVNSLLQTRWTENLAKEAESFCIDQALKFYPKSSAQVYTPSFFQAVSSENLAVNFSELAELLRQNTVFENIAKVPILILQGRLDPLVTVLAQAENRESLCAAGATVQYQEYAFTNHFQTRAHSFFDSLEWMRSREQGIPELGNCKTTR